eukprot:2710105-Pyramimonas_sp.AAC.1
MPGGNPARAVRVRVEKSCLELEIAKEVRNRHFALACVDSVTVSRCRAGTMGEVRPTFALSAIRENL